MIHPVILCNDADQSLWPSARATYPKPFAPIFGVQSPFQHMLELFSGSSFDAPIIITRPDFRFLSQDQAGEAGVWDARYFLEAGEGGSASSVLMATLMTEDDPEAILLIAPPVHFAGDAAQFQSAIAKAATQVRKGAIVRFLNGIADTVPDKAAALENAFAETQTAFLSTTIEEEESNNQLLPGMILVRRADLLAAFDTLVPKMLAPCRKVLEQAQVDGDTLICAPEDLVRLPKHDFSADILPAMKGALSMPLGAPCSALSDWDSVWTVMDHDPDGVAGTEATLAVDCRNTMLRCDESAMQVLGIGLDNIVAVAGRDAVLVAHRDHLSKIPGALDRLAARKSIQAREYPRYHRPWGWYESLIARDRFQVKRIMVKPGGVLSLQSHVHRSEHWIVVGGTAEVTVNDSVTLVPENGSAYIPLGATHRMANPGKVPMYLIEVQTGTYLGEDDIVRYEDIYNRC